MTGLLFSDDKPWRMVKDGNAMALDLYSRHYSCRMYKDGRERKLFCGPGAKKEHGNERRRTAQSKF